jgi:MoxR-like ATPase
MSEQVPQDDIAAVQNCERAYNRIRDELSKVIVGQNDVIEQVLVAMFGRGHALLEGVPGLAKTLLISSLARSLHLTFKRIQFTPDLMPSDVTGTEVIQEDPETRQRAYKFLPGPVFANMLLADEINRTPPKTQAAMLEAMQERQVSAGGHMHKLPAPFFVLATQNPLEQEGTYPLPEAQLDRFLLYIKVDYPSGAEEWEIARRVTTGQLGEIVACMSGEEIIQMQNLVTRVPVSDQVLGYAWAMVRASRPHTPEAPDFVNRWVPGRAACSRSSRAPRRGPFSTAATTRPWPTCRPSPSRPFGTALPATTPRRPTASGANSSSTCSWKRCRPIGSMRSPRRESGFED